MPNRTSKMKKNQVENNPTGFLLIDKPLDWTSHDVVGYIRKIVREYYKKIGLPDEARRAKAGHSGTLDPFATGLLIVAVGRAATRQIDKFKNLDKEYIAKIQLGYTSDTLDSTGEIKQCNHVAMEQFNNLTKSKIKQTLKSFLGEQTQTPPMYSAKKVGGKKLYELARKGIEIERKASKIKIHKLKLLKFDKTNNTIEMKCLVSKGTYIRTLAADIGEALGTGAYCKELRRTSIGKYKVKKAIEPNKLNKNNWTKRLI